MSPLAEEARVLLRIRQAANLVLAIGTPTQPPRFVFREIDLDGDGLPEVLVLQLGAADCMAASCQLDILARDTNGRLFVRQTIRNTGAPVAVGPGSTAGWRDLLRTDSAAGDLPAVVAMAFDGQHCVDGPRMENWPADADADADADAEVVFDAAEAWSRSMPLVDRVPGVIVAWTPLTPSRLMKHSLRGDPTMAPGAARSLQGTDPPGASPGLCRTCDFTRAPDVCSSTAC
jgi:hypothetical protein